MPADQFFVWMALFFILGYGSYYLSQIASPSFGGEPMNLEWYWVAGGIFALCCFPPLGVPALLIAPFFDLVTGGWRRVLICIGGALSASFVLIVINMASMNAR